MLTDKDRKPGQRTNAITKLTARIPKSIARNATLWLKEQERETGDKHSMNQLIVDLLDQHVACWPTSKD